MTGPVWSVIGFNPETVLPRFINALPTRFEVGEGPVVFNACQVDIDPATGRALQIERISARRRGLTVTSGAARAAPGRGRRAVRPRRRGRGRPHPHAPLGRRPRAAGARAPGRTTPGSGCSPIADHDNLAGVPRADRARRAAPLPAGPRRSSRPSRSTPSRAASDLDLPEGELHVLGIGVDPTDDGVRGGPREPARRPPAALRRRPSRGCARSGCRSTPISRPATSTATTRSAGPTLARALVAAGSRRERRGRVPRGSSPTGQPGYVPRTRPRPGRGDPRDPRRRRPRLARALLGGARPDLAPARRSSAEGLDGLETPPPLVRPRDARRDGRDRAARSASSRPAARTTTATWAPYAEAHAGLVMPDAWSTGAAATRRSASPGRRPARP